MNLINKILSSVLFIAIWVIPVSLLSAPLSRHSTNYFHQLPKYPLEVIFERNYSMNTGASLLRSTFNIYKKLDDYALPQGIYQNKFLYLFTRFGKTILLDPYISQILSTTQHEVFGHGGRLREFDVPIIEYDVNLRGTGSGFTRFDGAKFSRLTPSEQTAVTFGGLEAEYLLARSIRTEWFEQGYADSRDASLYLISNFSQLNYIFTTSDPRFQVGGHDIFSYLSILNRWYGKNTLTSSELRKYMFLDLFDPFKLFTLFTQMNYIINDQKKWYFPMININEILYLPIFRLVLAPYGPEVMLSNYFKWKKHVLDFHIRFGSLDKFTMWSIGASLMNLWDYKNIFLDGCIEVWNQPELFTSNATTSTQKFGALGSLTSYYKLNNYFKALVQVGYKASGYVIGERLQSGLIIRGGIIYRF